MKKSVSIILVVIMLVSSLMGFSACTGGGGGTKLSVSNFATYFNVYTTAETSGNLTSTSSHYYYGYPAVDIICKVLPISTNFIYNDVVVKIKMSGSYKYFDTEASYEAQHERFIDEPQSFETTVTINVSIAGSGNATQTYNMPEGKLMPNFGFEAAKNYVVCNYEILSVSGSVEKA